MIMRRASVNVYNGAGMEISDWDAQEELEERRDFLEAYRKHYHAGAPSSSTYVKSRSDPDTAASSLPFLWRSQTFDERHSIDRDDCLPHLPESPFTLYRSLSEDELSSMLLVAHECKCDLCQ